MDLLLLGVFGSAKNHPPPFTRRTKLRRTVTIPVFKSTSDHCSPKYSCGRIPETTANSNTNPNGSLEAFFKNAFACSGDKACISCLTYFGSSAYAAGLLVVRFQRTACLSARDRTI